MARGVSAVVSVTAGRSLGNPSSGQVREPGVQVTENDRQIVPPEPCKEKLGGSHSLLEVEPFRDVT